MNYWKYHLPLGFNSDYRHWMGPPERSCAQISEAGFSHVHWCHHWTGDRFYTRAEVKKIGKILQRHRLELLDLHASAGIVAGVSSRIELRRRAGSALLQNRIKMCGDLGGGAVVLHVTSGAAMKTLDEAAELCRRTGVRIALENLAVPGHAHLLGTLLDTYDADYIGLCYDTGHANLMCRRGGSEADILTSHPERLIALHLHDNEGVRDQHLLPFDGTIDWHDLVSALAGVNYTRPLCLECSYARQRYGTEHEFLAAAYRAAERLHSLVPYESEGSC
jgi:sugar phosphate isomerase/epimerase